MKEFQGKVAEVTGAARVESSDSTAIQQISWLYSEKEDTS
jgi:hypothetical protein